MAYCDRHMWDEVGRIECWKCNELKYQERLNYKNMATEGCVICGKDTGVAIETHIDLRHFYEEGVGQLCKECFTKVVPSVTEDFQGNKEFSQNEKLNGVIINAKLITETPNDSELGAKIRELWSYRKH